MIRVVVVDETVVVFDGVIVDWQCSCRQLVVRVVVVGDGVVGSW